MGCQAGNSGLRRNTEEDLATKFTRYLKTCIIPDADLRFEDRCTTTDFNIFVSDSCDVKDLEFFL